MADILMINQIVLGYKVDALLGSGGFGKVYRVSKTDLSGTSVRALKHIAFPTSQQYAAVLRTMGDDHGKTQAYFREALGGIVGEVKIFRHLSEDDSANIVRYYDNQINECNDPVTGQLRFDIFILMEYLTPFPDYISRRGFTLGDVFSLGMDIASALRICHVNGVIHRDIKDDNIFVTERGRFKLGDFGVSKKLDASSRAESMKGTPAYIAPEVYTGRGAYTKSVDLYSLGMVLYHLLNHSRAPFLPPYPNAYSSAAEEAAFAERMKGTVPPPPAMAPEALAKVLVKAVSGQGERYQDTDGFTKDLLAARAAILPGDLVRIVSRASAQQTVVPGAAPGPAGLQGQTNWIGQRDPTPYDATVADRHRGDMNRNLFGTENLSVQRDASDKDTKPVYRGGNTPGSKAGMAGGRAVGSGGQGGQGALMEGVRPESVPVVAKKDAKWLAIALIPVVAIALVIVFFVVVPALTKDDGGGQTVAAVETKKSSKNKATDADDDDDDVGEVDDGRATAGVTADGEDGSAVAVVDLSGADTGARADTGATAGTEYASPLEDWVATASSIYEPYTYYGADKVLDRDYRTAWVEAADGPGVGEWIQLSPASGNLAIVSNVAILRGYREDENKYPESNRPVDITLEFSDGSSQNVRLGAGFYEADNIVLDKPIATSFVRVVIKGVDAGTVYDDTCISEIIVNASMDDINGVLPSRASQTVERPTVPAATSAYRPSAAPVTGGYDGYVLPYSSSSYYSASDLYGLSDSELRIARNEIYARHGRLFSDKSLQAYFDSQSWYNGYISPSAFNENTLNTYEKKNIELIVAEETRRK
jgi:serine/threonine protein kinase